MFRIDLKDYEQPNIRGVSIFRQYGVLVNAAEKYLDNKAFILSQYINKEHPIIYKPSYIYKSSRPAGYGQEVENTTYEEEKYILNFIIPISICEKVLYSLDILDNNCGSRKLTEIDIKRYIIGKFWSSGIKIKAPYFITRLIAHIEKIIKTSILNPHLLEKSIQIQKIQKNERNRQYELERPIREKKLELNMEQYEKTKKCDAYIKTANDKVDTLNKMIAKYKQVAIEQEQLFETIKRTYPITIQEQQEIAARYEEAGCEKKSGGGKYKRTAKKRKIRKSTSKRRK